jgi:hypothetical protein
MKASIIPTTRECSKNGIKKEGESCTLNNNCIYPNCKMKNTAIIDADHIFFLCLTGEKILDENGEPVKVDGKFTYRERTFEESCKIADDYITNILNVTEADSYIGFFGGSSAYRKRIYPEYKANRKDLEPLKNLEKMKHYLLDKWGFIWIMATVPANNYMHETDDYVASYYFQNSTTSFIVSPDKDLLNLKGRHYNPKKNEWVDKTIWDEYRYFWGSMIVGDNADNIPGLKGKAEAFVEKLFADTTNYPERVLSAYIGHYSNIDLAIEEFYKHYKCLSMVKTLQITTGDVTNSWTPSTVEEQQLNIE